MNIEEQVNRNELSKAKRIVVKVGSRILVKANGRPDEKKIQGLVNALADLRKEGRELVLVSSGAVGAGLQVLDRKTRPSHLPDLQMAAAVGQIRLMALYERLFKERSCAVGQVLLTHDGLKNRSRHLNARNTLLNLLRHRIIPIVNENDVVSTDEIKFGDNDILASLVAMLIQADALVLLSTTNGLNMPTGNGTNKRLSYLPKVTREILRLDRGAGSAISTGGMTTKLQAAQSLVKLGGYAVIADGRKSDTLSRIFKGDSVGTLIGSSNNDQQLSGRKKWIAFFNRSQGSLTIDAGAQKALEKQGRSLLAAGIKKVQGNFSKGALVEVTNTDNTVIARGLTDYDSETLSKIKSLTSTDIKKKLGHEDYKEVIHRDNMVVLNRDQGDII